MRLGGGQVPTKFTHHHRYLGPLPITDILYVKDNYSGITTMLITAVNKSIPLNLNLLKNSLVE